MYAIIATGGKQYKVSEGDIIKVEKLGVEAGETYTFDQLLAVLLPLRAQLLRRPLLRTARLRK